MLDLYWFFTILPAHIGSSEQQQAKKGSQKYSLRYTNMESIEQRYERMSSWNNLMCVQEYIIPHTAINNYNLCVHANCQKIQGSHRQNLF